MNALLCRTMLGVLCLFGPIGAASAADAASDPASATYFEQHIRPLLVGKCLKCHGPKKQEGSLRLDSRAALLAGGDSGAAVVPHDREASLLVEAVRYEGLEMPPSEPLEDEAVARFEAWVEAGAIWPAHAATLRESSGAISDQDRQWWAFQPLQQPAVPQHPQDAWSQTTIDRFVYQRLAEHEMRPAPVADRVTLVRRLYYDLIGLPPTPAQIDAFLQDESPVAWEELIDRLMDDRRYGEHWARFWLDLVRYAESDGWNQDAYRPLIWRYRDYVIDAFNADKPYPQFVREQLAGDELPGDDPQQLIATGFLRLGIYEYNQRDARSHWDDIMNEMTDVTGDVFLALGMACARCHDHKFDPILQSDYFRLRAFFEPIQWRDDLVAATDQAQATYRQELVKWESATEEIRAQIDALVAPYHERKWESTVEKFPLDIQACFYKPVEERNSWEQQMSYLVSRQFEEEGGGPLRGMKQADKEKLAALKKELAAFDEQKPQPLPAVMAATDFAGEPAATTIPDDPEATPIAPGFLSVLSQLPGGGPPKLQEQADSTGRRTALAEWIGRPDNPLTTRVIVNRIWQQHFGRGLVPTASDFGHLGQPPSHPELLDWLTIDFVEHGWSFKRLHKQILMSAVWQQAAEHPQAAEYQAQDPAEKWLWRAPVRRLEAEAIRDAMLLASGELEPAVGGPSVTAKMPRRGLYVKRLRNKGDPFLHAFDMADGLKSVSERNVTTTPTQSLLMINGSYVLARAKAFAERLQQAAKVEEATPAALLRRAFRMAWGRAPRDEELRRATEWVASEASPGQPVVEAERLVDFCHVLLNSNEFLYID